MCESCVKAGIMTEDERIKLQEGSMSPDVILARIFGEDEVDPNKEATERMDSAVASTLNLVRSAGDLRNMDASALDDALQGVAASIMFSSSHASVSMGLAVMTHRYNNLLSEWADLYVGRTMAEGEDTLEAPGVAETGEAVKLATKMQEAQKAEPTGMSGGTGLYV